jgi:hypothetical protein
LRGDHVGAIGGWSPSGGSGPSHDTVGRLCYRRCVFVHGVLLALATCAAAAQEPEFYRYVKNGRPVFVSDLDQVPPELRGSAEPIDLSDLELEDDPDRELDQGSYTKIETDHETRERGNGADPEDRTDAVCTAARTQDARTWYEVIWHDHAYIVALGALALLLLASIPFLGKRIGMPESVRIALLVIVPLVWVGGFAYVLVETRKSLSAARDIADLCEPEAGAPDTLIERMTMDFREAQDQRRERIDRAIDEER